jgi:hypothetical protein
MTLPLFSAAASIYNRIAPIHVLYQAKATSGLSNRRGVGLATDTCQCTSPNCTWTCPAPDPCLQLCGKIANPCARKRCVCTCNGGVPVSAPGIPCGFVCT